MEAIGMIETKGLIAVVEALDVMLKTSNVSLVKKEKIGAGYVSVIVKGDVSAVKSAVDAAVGSVNILGDGFLKSHHVIPRASQQVGLLFEDDQKIKNDEIEKTLEIEETIQTQQTIQTQEITEIEKKSETQEIIETETITEIEKTPEVETVTEIKETIQLEKEPEIEETTQTEQTIQIQEQKDNKKITLEDIKDKKLTKEMVDELVRQEGIDSSIKMLEKLRVNEIRTLAKKYKDTKLTSKEISKLSKKRLLKEMKNYYQGGSI